jgi:integrase
MGAYVDDKKSALRCPDHGHFIASQFKVKFRNTTSRYDSYTDAKLCLAAKREDLSTGVFQTMDRTLGEIQEAFLDWKFELVNMKQIKGTTLSLYRSRLNRITGFIGPMRKLGDIGYRQIHDFIHMSDYSLKSKYDSYVIFKEMVLLAHDLGDWPKLPKFPPWRYNLDRAMKLRKTITKEEQEKVLDAVYHCEWTMQPRLYVAIKFLCTYVNVRPGELLAVDECDVNKSEGILVIRKHKTGSVPKVVRLIQEDVTLLNSLPKGFPGMPLFRHDRPVQRVKVGQRFGQAAFSRAWQRACKVVGIEGVDLYGGTRHSSAIALYQDAGLSPEQVKKATGHKSSSSFNRYFRMDIDDIAELHAKAAPTRREVV